MDPSAKVTIKPSLFGFFFKGRILILEIIRESHRMIIKLWACAGNFYKKGRSIKGGSEREKMGESQWLKLLK